jgi:hypothetical protein
VSDDKPKEALAILAVKAAADFGTKILRTVAPKKFAEGALNNALVERLRDGTITPEQQAYLLGQVQGARQQENQFQVIQLAAKESKALPPAAEGGSPDPDFVSRLLSDAADFCDPDVQVLWARILAGEVNSPGSFSRRTLSVLRDLDSQNAQTFEQLLPFVFGPTTFFLTERPGQLLEDTIGYGDILALADAGLVIATPTAYSFSRMGKIKLPRTTILLPDCAQNRDLILADVLPLTRAAQELAGIVADVQDADGIVEAALSQARMVCKEPKIVSGGWADRDS